MCHIGKKVEFDDPHLAAVILKLFLRELPEPVLMYSTYSKIRGFKSELLFFMRCLPVQILNNTTIMCLCVQLSDLEEDQKIVRCKQIVEELVEPNKTVFRYLIDFLVKVRTKMLGCLVLSECLVVKFCNKF